MAILNFRHILHNGKISIQALIQWKGCQDDDNSWVDWEGIKSQFLGLEDKAKVNEGDIVIEGCCLPHQHIIIPFIGGTWLMKILLVDKARRSNGGTHV